LYYDEHGKVICYTCDVIPGDNYIEIDRQTYAECNPNIRIVDGKICRDSNFVVIAKLTESENGVECEPNDICILTSSEVNKKWKIKINEFRNY
jgi:hypothetical protein